MRIIFLIKLILDLLPKFRIQLPHQTTTICEIMKIQLSIVVISGGRDEILIGSIIQ
jgi:hypothetical protein